MLTGVGIYDNPSRGTFVAPPDANASWDVTETDDDNAFGANQQLPYDGRHGFLFHVACWALLERYCHPDPVELPRLFEVLNSLPFPLESTAINWGHDYGGLVLIHDQYHYPWEDRYVDPDWPEPPILPTSNPYDIGNDLADLISLARVPYQKGTKPPQNSLAHGLLELSASNAPCADCFGRLPAELCLAIASYLPTSDALCLRLVSRAFHSVFHDQQFWASRFWPGSADRSWLWEVQGQGALNWRLLYRETHLSRLSPALGNRRRIWTLIEHMASIFSLHSDGLEPHTQDSPALQSDGHVANYKPACSVTSISGDDSKLLVNDAFSYIHKGCRTLYKGHLYIPRETVCISVSTVDVGKITYIAGLRFITRTQRKLEIGYRSAYQATDSVEVSSICGFNVAVGSKGIQALQCIFETGELSSWLGNPHEGLRTRRLEQFRCSNVQEWEFGFDVSLLGCLSSNITYIMIFSVLRVLLTAFFPRAAK